MPAGRAGLVAGDQLLRYGGREVHDIPSLRRAIYEAPPDGGVLATVLRDGQELKVWIEPGVLGARMQVAPERR